MWPWWRSKYQTRLISVSNAFDISRPPPQPRAKFYCPHPVIAGPCRSPPVAASWICDPSVINSIKPRLRQGRPQVTGVASECVSLKKCVGIPNMTGAAVKFCIPCQILYPLVIFCIPWVELFILLTCESAFITLVSTFHKSIVSMIQEKYTLIYFDIKQWNNVKCYEKLTEKAS